MQLQGSVEVLRGVVLIFCNVLIVFSFCYYDVGSSLTGIAGWRGECGQNGADWGVKGEEVNRRRGGGERGVNS